MHKCPPNWQLNNKMFGFSVLNQWLVYMRVRNIDSKDIVDKMKCSILGYSVSWYLRIATNQTKTFISYLKWYTFERRIYFTFPDVEKINFSCVNIYPGNFPCIYILRSKFNNLQFSFYRERRLQIIDFDYFVIWLYLMVTIIAPLFLSNG